MRGPEKRGKKGCCGAGREGGDAGGETVSFVGAKKEAERMERMERKEKSTQTKRDTRKDKNV